MASAFLLTGSNMGDRAQMLQIALESIGASCGDIAKVSRLYETAAWGKEDQNAFLNQAIHIQTTLSPVQLLKKVLDIEKEMGRLRKERYGPRVIDIDILLYDQQIIKQPGLQVPHPQMQNRRFALVPLAELVPDLPHPVLKETIQGLLRNCPDKLPVQLWPVKNI